MNTRRSFLGQVALGAASVTLGQTAQNAPAASTSIELLVRGDDMGVAAAVNEATLKTVLEGIVRSVEVIVPGPWFLHAAKLLREHPRVDVGVHLCLTSEWENVKWAPLTRGRTLVDPDGYFYPMTGPRKDFPPGTSFLEAKPNLEEVEKELRAQIEMAMKHIQNVTHVSAHMGAAAATPELRAIKDRLVREYKLAAETEGLQGVRGPASRVPQERATELAKTIQALTPGRWLLVEHPGLDTPEMRLLGHAGYYDVAQERDAVTRSLTNPRIANLIQSRGIKLISYGDLRPD